MSQYIDFEGGKVMIDAIKEQDRAAKGGSDFDGAVGDLIALFEDSLEARNSIRTYLAQNKLGLQSNSNAPLQVGLLDLVIEKLSGRYDTPASRRLLRDGKRLSENGPEHRRMVEIVKGLQLDAAMGELDRRSTLCGSVLIRPYPTTRGLRLRAFTPDLVMMVPADDTSDELEAAPVICLKLSGKRYEVHIRRPDGTRMMFRCDDKGAILPDQPFEDGLYPEPYDGTVPIVRLDDRLTLGRPWLPIRLSRSSYVKAMSGLQADLQAMTALQSSAIITFLTDDPNHNPPDGIGPGTVAKLDRSSNDELRIEHLQPMIDQVGATLDRLAKMFLLGEKAPLHLLDKAAPPTGAALKVAESALRARRDQGRGLAQQTERDLWRVIRVLHNAHELGPSLAPDTELEATLNSADAPQSDAEILENGAKGQALGVTSPITTAQRLYGVGREQAIEIVTQAREDLTEFPPPAAASARQVSQGDSADVVAAANGQESADSVLDSATGRTAADARAERRASAQEAE